MKVLSICAAVAALFASSHALAHGDEAHPTPRRFDAGNVEATPFGQEGDPRRVTRTIQVGMTDQMRFTPSSLTVRRGETVKFVVRNDGRLLHEMVLGTPQALKEHAELMKKFPGMEHADPSIAHVKPGNSGEIVWEFTQPGQFEFACLQPGHFEAGMAGRILVQPSHPTSHRNTK